MRRIFELAKNRFGFKVGVAVVTPTVILFASNPEFLSFVIVVNAIGIDVFLVFLSFQLRSHVEVASRYLIYPVLHRFRRLQERCGKPTSGGDK